MEDWLYSSPRKRSPPMISAPPSRRPVLSCCLTVLLGLVLTTSARPAEAPAFKLGRTLENPAAAEGDQFGQAVAMVGENVLVGARWADMGGTDAGAAFLFDGKTGELLLTLQKPEPAAGDWFGNSVAAVGSNLLVGALGDDTGATDAGAAYLFDGKTGELLRTFQKPTQSDYDWFGASVAAVGNNVLVGAFLDDTGATDAGAAYLFDSSTGTLLQTFRNPTPAKDDWFSFSLAAAGEWVYAGAFQDDTGKQDAGAVYQFNAATGELLQTFQKPEPAAGDQFGFSLAAAGSQILMGVPGDDTGQKDAGAVFHHNVHTDALPVRVQAPTPTAGELFGSAVAFAADQLLVGAPRAVDGKAGAAYLIDRATGTVQALQNATPADGDQFGAAVAATETALLVGAYGDHSGTNLGGAAFLFTR
jgi:outer membrane protein assembly factor BamB